MVDTTDAIRDEIREQFAALNRRIDRIERGQRKQSETSERVANKIGAVEEQVTWDALITDLKLCLVCALISTTVASIDWIKGAACDNLPSWGRASLPLCSNAPVTGSNASVTPGSYGGVSIDAEQAAIASTIITTGREQGMSDRDITIALMTALQESGMRNLNYGDDWWFDDPNTPTVEKSDSVGVFQQRDSWGSVEVRMNPSEAAKLFYRALAQVSDRHSLEPGDVAQAVQRSAFPDHYDKWEPVAQAILDSAGAIAFILPSTGTITSGYGYRMHPISGQCKPHEGIDFGAAIGSPVLSTAGGTVTFASDANDGYGLKVIIDHGNGYSSLYGHNSQLMVQQGQMVEQGQAIALVGSTGNSTGPHLHFEILKDGGAIDPAPLIGVEAKAGGC